MPRKRLIAPQFFTHEELYDAEYESGLPLRLAFAGLWTQADRRGIFEWKPRQLKLAILPFDEVPFAKVLEALAAHGFVQRYEADGRSYGVIPSFARWQTFHQREYASDAPAPPTESGGDAQHSAGTVSTPGEHSASTRSALPITVTVTGTGTVTGAEAAQPRTRARTHAREHEARPVPAPVPAPVEHNAGPVLAPIARSLDDDEGLAVALAVAANRGITARFGEQPSPIRASSSGTMKLVELLRDNDVDAAWAVQRLEALARDATTERPPKSVWYFGGALLDVWAVVRSARGASSDSKSDDASDGLDALVPGMRVSKRYAQQAAEAGDAEWKLVCDTHGIPYFEAGA